MQNTRCKAFCRLPASPHSRAASFPSGSPRTTLAPFPIPFPSLHTRCSSPTPSGRAEPDWVSHGTDKTAGASNQRHFPGCKRLQKTKHSAANMVLSLLIRTWNEWGIRHLPGPRGEEKRLVTCLQTKPTAGWGEEGGTLEATTFPGTFQGTRMVATISIIDVQVIGKERHVLYVDNLFGHMHRPITPSPRSRPSTYPAPSKVSLWPFVCFVIRTLNMMAQS